MILINFRVVEESLVMHFCADFRNINAYTIAKTLESFTNAAKSANAIINPDYELEILVDALDSGSSKVKVKTIYKCIRNSFSTKNLLPKVFSAMVSYLAQLCAPMQDIIINNDDSQVVIKHGEKKIVIPREIYDAHKKIESSEMFRENFNRIVETLEEDENIKSFGFTKEMEDQEFLIEVPRSIFRRITAIITKRDAWHINRNDESSPEMKPGTMVKIPNGLFLYGNDKKEIIIPCDYYIDAFPVTNQQYQEFLNDPCYPEGLQHRVPYLEGAWAEPYNWDPKNRTYPKGKENHPVVLVSFYDAEAFCKWRSQKKGIKYKLPDEEQWEKAARGKAGREYPWGDEFDKVKCNTAESGNKGTTPVDKYSNGASPYGCRDMAGNVWEWTSSGGSLVKVLRGGSWDAYCDFARCAYRLMGSPIGRDYIVGFRCAKTSF